MSLVTSVIMFSSYIPEEVQRQLDNGYDNGGRRISFPLMNIPSEYTSGSKVYEAEVAIAGFNYLNWEQFCMWVNTMPWHDTVVFVGEMNGDSGPMIHVVPGKDGFRFTMRTEAR